jgi:hypothetical protein
MIMTATDFDLDTLSAMSDEQLNSLAAAVALEQARRVALPATFRWELKTCDYYDHRKHGHAYIARLAKDSAGKVIRLFVDGGSRLWDSKRRTYTQTFVLDVRAGEVLECRLNDGSWKNDHREWFIVGPAGERREVTQQAAFEAAPTV